MHGAKYVFYHRHGGTYVLWRGFALRLILWERLVAEGLAVVERHADEGGALLLQYLVEGVDKSHDGRGVHAFGVDARVLDERVVGTVDERVGVEKKKFVHVVWLG